MNIISFTGSQHGMTVAQQEQLYSFLSVFDSTEVHHGDCWGADELFNRACLQLDRFYISAHPGVDKNGLSPKRAYCTVHNILPEQPYLKRNRTMVDLANVLIAAPMSMVEQRRSGTWSTIRYAIDTETNVVLIFPDGSCKYIFF